MGESKTAKIQLSVRLSPDAYKLVEYTRNALGLNISQSVEYLVTIGGEIFKALTIKYGKDIDKIENEIQAIVNKIYIEDYEGP